MNDRLTIVEGGKLHPWERRRADRKMWERWLAARVNAAARNEKERDVLDALIEAEIVKVEKYDDRWEYSLVIFHETNRFVRQK